MSEIWSTLLPQIEYLRKPFPEAAIEYANTHRVEVTPYLVDVLARVAADPGLASNSDYVLHLYAMHLLASWREPSAYLPMVRLGRHDEAIVEVIMGDTVTESYSRCLASVCDGNLAPLKELIEDRSAGHWPRNAALDALMVRVLEGDGERDELLAYLMQLGDAEAARLRQPDTVAQTFELLDSIAGVAADIGAGAMHERIRGWFADRLLNPSIADLPWFERHLGRSFEVCQDEMRRFGKGYVTCAKAEMGWWAAFSENPVRYRESPPQPIRRTPKIGRNDPCPCGSGKKYKKCCGARAD